MEEFISLKILGRGATGELTKKVKSKSDEKLYVIKDLGQDKLTENQQKVLNILIDDECPYIVRHYKSENYETLIKTDYINDTDLLDFTNTYMDLGKSIEEKTLWKLMWQCSEAIKYLHEKNIIHRNIRLENFYMTDEKDIKLGNFKHATIKSDNEEDEDMNYPEGGMLYKNADTLNNSIYDKRSDIYALGVLFHKMYYFKFPYEPIFNGNRGEFELRPFSDDANIDYDSNDFTKLIKRMLEEEQLDINTIYEQALNTYKNKYIKNTSIKSALGIISSLGAFYFALKEVQKSMKIEKASFPLLANFHNFYNFFQQPENKEDKIKNHFIDSINYFRTVMENYYELKIDEDPRPIEVIKTFFAKFSQEMDATKLNHIKDSITKTYYGLSSLNSTLYSLADDKFLFNFLKINLDKCIKDNNKYDLLSLIQNVLKPNTQNGEFKYNYISYPRYLIIDIEREKNFDDKTSVSIPKVLNLNKNYQLFGIIFRKFENGEIIFNAVYTIKMNNNTLKWMILEGDSLKEINDNNYLNKSYGIPEILIYK